MNIQAIKDHIEEFGVPSRMVCPFCGGGSRDEECMTIFFADNERTVLATCHRANCSMDTLAVDGGEMRTRLVNTTKVNKREDLYTKYSNRYPHGEEIRTHREWPWPSMKVSLLDRFARYDSSLHAVIIRQLDENNNPKGVVVRYLDKNREGSKAYTFTKPDYHGMGFFSDVGVYPESWYGYTRCSSSGTSHKGVDPLTLLVVEDSISALRAADAGWDAVSLNGTHINRARMEAMQSCYHNLILCLDADATRDAIKAASKYIGTGSMQVRRLVTDFKDMTTEGFKVWAKENLTG